MLSIELPPRFRKSLWIRRGSFIVINIFETTEETSSSKLDGEVAIVLQPDQVKSWKKRGLWPNHLDPKAEESEEDVELENEIPESPEPDAGITAN